MQFHIQDMTCGGCATRITKTVQAIDPAAKVDTDVSTKRVTIQSSASQEQIEAALNAAGYPPKAL